MPERSDEELMAAYVAGERAAFTALFDRYAPRLQRMLRRDLGRVEDAADLVQQTFLQLHRARNDFRPGSPLRPWLYTIALNLKRQQFRRAGRRPETLVDLQEAGEPAAASGDPESRLSQAKLRAAVDQLPPGQRDVIALHWFEGLSFKEVAQVVGASESAAKVRAHRGYAKLRALLEEQGHVTGSGQSAYDPAVSTQPPQ